MKALISKYSSICLLTLLGCTTTPHTLTTYTNKEGVNICSDFSYLGYKDCKKESSLYIVSNDSYDALISSRGELLTPYKYRRLEVFGKNLFRDDLATWEAVPEMDTKV
jgi:ABC-type oligopeptide transport system substrate-binding subunit